VADAARARGAATRLAEADAADSRAEARKLLALTVAVSLCKIIMIVFIKTCKNIADIMTKQSPGPQFGQHRDYALGAIDAITTAIAAVAETRRRICVRV